MMTTEQAWAIVGNQPKWALRNMIKALSMLPALNTPADKERLVAARIAVRTDNPRYAS
jgi:hypothetical protein